MVFKRKGENIMVHAHKRRQPEELGLDYYRRTKTVPLAWQVYGKHKIGNTWMALSQQRQSKDDAEKDKKMLKYSVTTQVPPLFKEFKIIQVPASKSEISQRKFFKKVGLKGTAKGFVESVGGTIAETKWGGSIPAQWIGLG